MIERTLTGAATAPSQLAHVVFCTNDCKRMSDWYCEVLKGHTTFDNGGGGFGCVGHVGVNAVVLVGGGINLAHVQTPTSRRCSIRRQSSVA